MENFAFKIGNFKLVENIFPEKKATIYENAILFSKTGKRRQ